MTPYTIEPIEPTPDDVQAWDHYWQARAPHGVRLTVGDTSVALTRHDVRQLIADLERVRFI